MMGAHRGEGGRDWLQQDGPEQRDHSPNPWNMMIKHRQIHRRGRRSHMAVREEMYYRAVHGTAVLFLQNDAGFVKWAPTAERLAELTAAYRPSPSRPSTLSSPGPAPIAPGDKDSAPKAADMTQSAVMSPGGHEDNNNSSSSGSSSSISPRDKMAAV